MTSGIYERYLQQGASVYHHIIDPKTGFPTKSDLASLTIVSKSSLEGEIWTTRLFGKPIVQVVDQLKAQTGIEGIPCHKGESGLPHVRDQKKIILERKNKK